MAIKTKSKKKKKKLFKLEIFEYESSFSKMLQINEFDRRAYKIQI